MKKLIIVMAALLASTAAMAQNSDTWHYEDAVQVNGKAERKITPDEIYVAITIRDSDNKNQTVEQMEARMKREFAALGIDLASALKVAGMASAPRKRSDIDAQRSYELKVGSTSILASVFEVLGEMDIRTASVVRTTHSRIEDFRREVRIEAVKNAQQIASELAEAVDQQLGPAVWIVDNGFYESSPVPMYKVTRAVAMDSGFVGMGMEAGEQSLDMQEITLTYNVMAKFLLEYTDSNDSQSRNHN
ncbi:MAG: SIMPL domain-containing protein [Alistipes sp.]|jgi:uncharacterized protein YggE|nr:SIMPL domain-containing protein [Alistipes sp.]